MLRRESIREEVVGMERARAPAVRYGGQVGNALGYGGTARRYSQW
tara:strand:+ start:3199 stop:3333 length:135 start_codon:yes stop_codon:yes gene_type:complete